MQFVCYLADRSMIIKISVTYFCYIMANATNIRGAKRVKMAIIQVHEYGCYFLSFRHGFLSYEHNLVVHNFL